MNQQTEILELEITQEDIDNAIARTATGKEWICYSCVVSTAAQRQLENPELGSSPLYLNEDGCSIGLDGTALWYGDAELRQYMDWFDCDMYEHVTPRKFILTKAP